MKFNVSNKQKETKQDNTLATLKKEQEGFIKKAPQQLSKKREKTSTSLTQFYMRFGAEEWKLIEKYIAKNNVSLNKFVRFAVQQAMREGLTESGLLSNSITKRTSIKLPSEAMEWINQEAEDKGEFKYNIIRFCILQLLKK